jgi:hypothetical protein
MLDIWNHYNGRRGEFRSFDLPTEVVSYGSITDYVPGNYLWRYAGPGSVEDLPCGGHNVSLTLETVPPVAASVVGVDLFLRLRLSAGVANGGEYVPGINETITMSVAEGAAFVALNGIDQVIGISISTEAAVGDAEANGISGALYLGFVIGGAANTGALGINETISLNLVAGAADDGTSSTDPDFASVSLLLHMDGSNGSTTFTDSSSANRTITANGDAQISTAQSKFGSASAILDGTGDYISAGSAAFNPGSSDFTIEWWQKLSATGSTYSTIAMGSDSGIRSSDGLIQIYYNGGVPGSTNVAASSSGVSNTNWNHIAIVRSGSTLYLFLNGSLLTNDAANSVHAFGGDRFDIGRSTGTYGNAFNGYIDELRVTVGVARYTATFTAPTAPFPNS